MGATAKELATLVRGQLVGDGEVVITGARPIQEAGPADVTFVDDPKYHKYLRGSTAGVAVVGPHFDRGLLAAGEPKTLIEVKDPRLAFLKIAGHLKEAARPRRVGIDPRAAVAPSAKIGRDVAIHAFAVVGEDVVIGDGCTLHPGVVVGDGCRLGRDVTLYPHVVLYPEVTLGDRVVVHAGTVLGADGFGYQTIDGRHEKIPQLGSVTVGDDVEIGANGGIDRGMLGATSIGAGTKIDNLVQIGHNSQIGRHNILCGQVGISGSCTTGDYVVMGGQVGLKDHINIGTGAQIGAQSGLIRDVEPGQQIFGTPALTARVHLRAYAVFAKLPELQHQLKALQKQVEALAAQAK